MSTDQRIKVIFVCMGNICRSPTAHGVFRKLVKEAGLEARIFIDSAGTHAYHVGNPPDPRAQETARSRGIDLSDLRARQVTASDLSAFDYVLAMDEDNYQILMELCPNEMRTRIRLFMEFAPEYGLREVPDPYYGGALGFERVFDMIEQAAHGLLDDIRKRL